jgi:hydroxyacylglutathione hydrolase
MMLRELRAGNPSPMTLDGTRSWLVGDREVAIIDPGPALEAHVNAMARITGGGRVVAILVTHEHPDHAAAADAVAARTRAIVRGRARGNLQEGDAVPTDAGDLIALHTPGHTPDHMAFHWPDRRAVFCGDLMMGGLETALIAPPEGNLAQYLASLERLRDLEPAVIFPAHGPAFDRPAAAIGAYIAHRRHRLQQVTEALADGSPRSIEAVSESVYGGTIPAGLQEAALLATRAYLEHLEQAGSAVRVNGMFRRTPAPAAP